jgi:hypothetical protein
MKVLNTYCYVEKHTIQEGGQVYTLDPKDVVQLNGNIENKMHFVRSY